MQRAGSDLLAANFSWNFFTQAFTSLSKEPEQGEIATIGDMVGISRAPLEHKLFSLKLWRTISSSRLCDSTSLWQTFSVFTVQFTIWLYLALGCKEKKIHYINKGSITYLSPGEGTRYLSFAKILDKQGYWITQGAACAQNCVWPVQHFQLTILKLNLLL